MKKFINRAKICLNNEIGGPTLENMISIGFSFIVIGGLYALGRGIWDYLHRIPYENSTELSNDIMQPIIGYNAFR